jgi:hypothetical protein
MDVHDDPMPSTIDLAQGVCEQVSGDGLDDVLDESPVAGFQLAPLATRRDALVGDGGTTEPVLTQLRFDVSQVTPGGQGDEHDPGLHGESQRTNTDRLAGRNSLNHDSVDVGPQLHHARVGGPPHIHQKLELGFSQPHPQRPYGFQGSDAALIATCEHSDLAFLTQLTVHAVLVNRDAEHARGGLAVQILPVSEGLKRGDHRLQSRR